MTSMARKVTILLLFFLSLWNLPLCGSNPQFTASVNPTTVYEGEVFEITFTLDREGWGELQLPKLDGFQRISGPSRSFQTSIVNGVVQQRTAHTYRYRANEAGEHTIGSAYLQVNGMRLKSVPLTLLVLEKGEEETAADRDIFIRVSTSCDTCYMGQQIVADLELYTTVGITDYTLLSEPQFRGLQKYNYRNLRNFRTTRDTFQNRIYNKHVVYRFILSPQFPGSFGGESFDFRVVEEDRDSRWGGFFRMGGKTHYLSTEIPEIVVLPSPPMAPEDFNSLVGDFHLRSRLDTEEVRTGELLTLWVRLSGNGDLKAMSTPSIQIDGGASVADIQLLEETSREHLGRLQNSREWNILLRADEVGTTAIVPKIVAYNFETDSFYTLSPDTLFLTIVKGDQDGTATGWQGISGDNHTDGASDNWWYSPVAIIGVTALGISLAVLLFLFFTPRSRRKVVKLTKEEEFARAIKNARKIKNTQPKEYFARVLHALDIFISRSIDLPMSEWKDHLIKTQLSYVYPQKKADAIVKLREKLIKGTYGFQSFEEGEIEYWVKIIL
nr:BatD family protein [Saprospiraceae bacterium]